MYLDLSHFHWEGTAAWWENALPIKAGIKLVHGKALLGDLLLETPAQDWVSDDPLQNLYGRCNMSEMQHIRADIARIVLIRFSVLP